MPECRPAGWPVERWGVRSGVPSDRPHFLPVSVATLYRPSPLALARFDINCHFRSSRSALSFRNHLSVFMFIWRWKGGAAAADAPIPASGFICIHVLYGDNPTKRKALHKSRRLITAISSPFRLQQQRFTVILSTMSSAISINLNEPVHGTFSNRLPSRFFASFRLPMTHVTFEINNHKRNGCQAIVSSVKVAIPATKFHSIHFNVLYLNQTTPGPD